MGKERDISVDLLKFAAALLIVNSHMGWLYVTGKFLATGGAIGDALFFFCSGYTLFLGRERRFDNWYKRRISRIYPAIFCWAIVMAFIFHKHPGIDSIILYGGGWFVTCIMVYYVLIYFIRKYLIHYLWQVLGVSLIASVPLFFAYFNDGDVIYSSNFRLFFFFPFMLFGSIIGRPTGEKKFNTKLDVLMLGITVAAFYILQYLAKRPGLNWLQMVSVFILLLVTYYSWKVCNCPALRSAYNSKKWGFAIKFIGGLCLEMYIVQHPLFTTKMNGIFPINIPLMIIIVIVVAYLLRCLANIFSQIFKDQDMDWKKVFKLLSY